MNNNGDGFFEGIKGIIVIVLAILILVLVKQPVVKLVLCGIVFVASLLVDKFTGGGNL